jgi:hypothetical protein
MLIAAVHWAEFPVVSLTVRTELRGAPERTSDKVKVEGETDWLMGQLSELPPSMSLGATVTVHVVESKMYEAD